MKNFLKKYDLLFYLGIALLCLMVMSGIKTSDYRDTDSYMWANRMIDWISSGGWFERKFMLSNYPYGEILHWTRPLDVLWLGLYSFFKDFYPLKEAVFISGSFLSPVIGLFFVTAVYFAIKPFYNGFYRLIFMAAIFFPFPFQGAFGFLNPDHHVLILLLQLISFAFLMRWICYDKKKSAFLAGLFAAMSIWVTVESWIFFFMVLSVFLSGFVFYKRQLDAAITFVFGAFLTTLIATVINPPAQGFLYFDMGRISIAFVAMVGILLLLLKIINRYNIDKYSVLKKIICLIPIGCVSLCWMVALYYPVFTSELVDVWMYRINEMKSPLNSVKTTLCYLGTSLVSIFLWCHIVLCKRKLDFWHLAIGVFLLGYFLLTSYSMRFFIFLSLYAIIPFVDWIKFKTKDMKKDDLIPNQVMLVSFCYFLGAILIISCTNLLLDNEKEKTKLFLQDNYLLKSGEKTVLSDVFMGPEIIFETGRPVVATPYHRNEEGIMDSHFIFYGTDMNNVYKLLKKHQVEDVFLTVLINNNYYKNAPEDSFYKRILSQKNVPEWFELKHLKKEKTGYSIWGKIHYFE